MVIFLQIRNLKSRSFAVSLASLIIIIVIAFAISFFANIPAISALSPNTGGGASMATVCAFNAQNPAGCDYIADGINDEEEIQAAIDAMPGDDALGGGVLRLSEGQFNVGGTINFTKRATIMGQGIRATTIRFQDNTNVHAMFSCDSGMRETGIRYVRLDGNKRNQNRGSGIYIGSCSDPLYDFLLVQNFDEYGFHIGQSAFHIGQSAQHIWDFHIRNSLIEYNDRAGIYFNGMGFTMYGFIVNNYIAANGVGIWVRGKNATLNNSVKGLTISGNQIRLTTNMGILLEGSTAAINIVGNTIVDAGKWPESQGINSRDAVVLRKWSSFSPTSISIVGNTIGNDYILGHTLEGENTVRYGISVEDESKNIEVWGNAFVEIGGKLAGNIRVADTANVSLPAAQVEIEVDPVEDLLKGVRGFLPTNAGWISSTSGSGETFQAPGYLGLRTDTTDHSEALLHAIAGNLEPRSNSLFYGVDWSKRFILAFGVAREIPNTDAIAYVHLLSSPYHGDPSSPSIGIKIADTAITGQTYNTALCFTGTLTTLNGGGGMKWIVIDNQPSIPKTDFYVDGVLRGSIADTNCVPQTAANRIDYFVASIANNAAADSRLYVSNIQSR